MFLYQAANLDKSHYCSYYTSHIQQDRTIQRSVQEHVYTHILGVHCPYGNLAMVDCHHVALVSFLVEMMSVLVLAVLVGLVQVNLVLCASSITVD